MKAFAPLCVALFLAGCNAAPEAPTATAPAATPAAAPAPAPDAPAAQESKQATATGVVQSIDATAQTVTIAHDPVEALGWPEMTMTFPAPGVDLSSIKAGDAVRFDLTAKGMDGTITAISKQ
jgi:Cu(I)/Ag(I) efflux system protein CusF